MIKVIVIFILILLIPVSFVLKAQQQLTDSMRTEQIRFIQNALEVSKPNVNKWWYGWLGAYSIASVGQGVIYLTSNDQKTRQDMAFGAGVAALSAVLQGLTPLNTGRDAAIIGGLPETTSSEIQVKLEFAESMLKKNAEIERIGRSWQIHALNEAVNLGSGLVTWLAFKRSVWDGVSVFLLNSAVTEIQIWTQPHKTITDYEEYKRRYKSGKISPVTHQTEYLLKAYPGGIALNITF